MVSEAVKVNRQAAVDALARRYDPPADDSSWLTIEEAHSIRNWIEQRSGWIAAITQEGDGWSVHIAPDVDQRAVRIDRDTLRAAYVLALVDWQGFR